MSYTPKYDYAAKDTLPSGNSAKVIRGTELMEEFNGIKDAFIGVGDTLTEYDERITINTNVLASVKWNGEAISQQFNVSQVEVLGNGNGHVRVHFTKAINEDAPITLPDGSQANPGDFVNVVTPITTTGVMSMMCITDMRETYADFAVRTLNPGDNQTWEAPTAPIGFCYILIDQYNMTGTEPQ
jgi:hypothetical protein